MRGPARNKWKFLFRICKNGSALQHSDTPQAGQKLTNLGTSAVHKQVSRDGAGSSGVFSFNSQSRQGVLQALKVPCHTHPSRQGEGLTETPGGLFPWCFVVPTGAGQCLSLACPGTPPAWCSSCIHRDTNAFPCANPHPEWGTAGSWLVLASPEHSVQPRSCAVLPHTQSFQRNASNDPALCTRVHLRQCYLPSTAWSKKQLNCFQGPPLTFCSQAHTDTWWAASIWIKLELEPSKPWAAPGNSTSGLGICNVLQQLCSPGRQEWLWTLVKTDHSRSSPDTSVSTALIRWQGATQIISTTFFCPIPRKDQLKTSNFQQHVEAELQRYQRNNFLATSWRIPSNALPYFSREKYPSERKLPWHIVMTEQSNT